MYNNCFSSFNVAIKLTHIIYFAAAVNNPCSNSSCLPKLQSHKVSRLPCVSLEGKTSLLPSVFSDHEIYNLKNDN